MTLCPPGLVDHGADGLDGQSRLSHLCEDPPGETKSCRSSTVLDVLTECFDGDRSEPLLACLEARVSSAELEAWGPIQT